MLVMVVFFIAFRWIHLSTPLIRLFLLVLILLLMPTLNFLPVWFALSLLRFRLPSRLPMMFDELAQCYNVLPQLDINNTIDHRPEGDEKWFLENEKTVTQFCRKLAAERPLKDI